ncbi:glycosyltransferase [Rossellomorea vietnamensis]|uniref:glycosyltransferase n=1 Tax=Rossellomorea vietnamensis TaxID=218284 RepID=UPI001E46BA6B|nr:glycosyltransferase [Rossellomorea vietnamensis]MCC5803537.1 glycosyltransferase [Rossellomorea vietnamensis]
MKDVGMVMPVYNQLPRYLRAALGSILKHQTYDQFHLIIVLDGANEETKSIVYEFASDPRCTIIEKKKNEGISKALNTGFEYLFKLDEVKYVTWGSSDNLVYPDFFKKLRDKLVSSPSKVGLVYSAFDHINENGQIIFDKERQDDLREWQQTRIADDLLESSFIGTSFMYKKKYAKQIGGFNLDPVQTYDFWLRLTEICDIAFVPEELMGYRLNSPMSLSKKIVNEKAKHRWWRDQFSLARHQARKRRNQPYETTIYFPVYTLDAGTIEEIETLLEQKYSSYWLVLIDTTQKLPAKLKELGIQDCRIIVKSPGRSDLKLPETSYQMIHCPDVNDLTKTMSTIKRVLT